MYSSVQFSCIVCFLLSLVHLYRFLIFSVYCVVSMICSASVFGVSAESMQCSYDSKGNSVPTILLLMQDRLYSQGGLKVLIIIPFDIQIVGILCLHFNIE